MPAQRNSAYKIYRNNTKRETAISIQENTDHAELIIPKLDSLKATAIELKIHENAYAIDSFYQTPTRDFIKNDYRKI